MIDYWDLAKCMAFAALVVAALMTVAGIGIYGAFRLADTSTVREERAAQNKANIARCMELGGAAELNNHFYLERCVIKGTK